MDFHFRMGEVLYADAPHVCPDTIPCPYPGCSRGVMYTHLTMPDGRGRARVYKRERWLQSVVPPGGPRLVVMWGRWVEEGAEIPEDPCRCRFVVRRRAA